MKTIRVMIVDDVQQARQDLSTLLSLVEGLEVVGEACNGRQAVEKIPLLNPDVILMDLEMPVLDGIEATRRIKAGQSAPRVIILSVHEGSQEQESARAAGADVFFVKGAAYEILVKAIRGRYGSS